MFTSISHRLCLVPVLPVVCWRAHVLFTLIVCVCAYWCPAYVVLCFCSVLFRLVYLVSFFKLSFLDCPLVFSSVQLWKTDFFPKLYLEPPHFHPTNKNLASVVRHTSLMLFHFSTVTTNFNGEGENLSLQILENRCLSFCPFIVLLWAIVLAVLRFTYCNYSLIYFSCYIYMIFFTCKE